MRASYFRFLPSQESYEKLGLGVAYAIDDSLEPAERKRFAIEDGSPADLQATAAGWNMCSPRLRAILDRFQADTRWESIDVETSEGQTVFFRPTPPDASFALDEERSILAKTGFVVKPVMRAADLVGLDFFRVASYFFVSARVKEAVEAEGCAGVYFGPAAVTAA